MNARPISDRILDLANKDYFNRNVSLLELHAACALYRDRRHHERTLLAIGFFGPLVVGIVVAAFA
jgi:hypothetical protein